MDMKKLLFAIPVLALALAGCVKDEPYVNPNPTPDPGPVDPVAVGKVYVNEVNCGTKEFEIYNGTNKAVDIAGYTFTKDDKDPWTVPAGKGNIPAKGFLVFTAKNADATAGPAFGLSGTKGFKLCMYKSDDTSEANLVDMMDNSATVEGFKTVEDGKSIGRKTDGADELVLFSTPSLGKSNSEGVIE